MPLPTHRLDVLVVAPHPDDPWTAALDRLFALGTSAGWWTEDGKGTPRSSEVVQGGVTRVARGHAHERRLLANAIGGFRVACPACGGSVAHQLHRSVADWRSGGSFELTCGRCGSSTSLDALTYRPHAAWASGWFELRDVGHHRLDAKALVRIEEAVGPFRTVLRRV
ncbi:MAG: hypothetical protein ACON5B_14680 [Myxococcota bacterium]